MKPLALDVPTFDRLREDGYLYVDKTREVYQMVRPGGGIYFFLSRPRRFGKSLLISTLEMLFEGRKELFEGLYIYDKIDWEKWGSFPVIRLNFSEINNAGSRKDFTDAIIQYLRINYAKKYGIDAQISSKDLKGYLGELAREITLKTGKRIALLIDEYDKPILDHITDSGKVEDNQKVLHGFYDFIKNTDRYWEIVFVTGISKFSKMSLFSAMSNLRDLSVKPAFNSLPGFTEEELRSNFADYIQLFADRMGVGTEEMMEKLRYYYDGYSWTGDERVYNPFSVINAFEDLKLNKYWYSTGTPSMLIPFLKKKGIQQPTNKRTLDFEGIEVTDDFFRSSDIEDVTVERLLFQTGYLTVKGSHRIGFEFNYFLGYPNFEVRWSFMVFLLHLFTEIPLDSVRPDARHLVAALEKEDLERAFELIRSFFNQIPHQLRKSTNEAYYHSLFQMMMTATGVQMQSERSSPKGSMDGVLSFHDKYYVIEFKYGNTGTMGYLKKEALKQVINKKYPDQLLLGEKRIICLGVGFLETPNEEKGVPDLEIGYGPREWPFSMDDLEASE